MTASSLWSKPSTRIASLLAVLLLVISGAAIAYTNGANQLHNRYLKLNNNRAGQVSNYDFGFDMPGSATTQNIVFLFCANDPLPTTVCVPPVGLDASGAVLTSQSGDVGFTISGLSTVNRLVLHRPPLPANGATDNYEFSNIVNAASNGSYFVRLATYDDDVASGTSIYDGGIAYALNDAVGVNAIVPPYLLFCVGITVSGNDCENVQGNYVDFGEFGSRQASQGTTQMLAASNAIDGYNIRVLGNTLTSGTNTIPALGSNDISRPGVSQFGMNLRANSSPQGGLPPSGPGSGVTATSYDQANFYHFTPGEIVASSTAPDEARKFTTSYIVNVQKDQAPGVYVATITYVALGSY